MTISINNTPVVHADVGLDRLIPIALLGDGIQRLISWTLTFRAASGGLMLIDEVENGIHHSKLHDLWRSIALFAKQYEVQVFATTHSLECVNTARRVFEDFEANDFHYLRLDRVKDEIEAKSFDRDMLETALGLDWEIR